MAAGHLRVCMDVMRGEDPGREMVCGVIGQVWKAAGTVLTSRDTREFVACAEPGDAKVAMTFAVRPLDHRTELRTETRVATTDPASRRQFGRSWRVIRPGSALIRRSWLRAAKRRGQQARNSAPQAPGANVPFRTAPGSIPAALALTNAEAYPRLAACGARHAGRVWAGPAGTKRWRVAIRLATILPLLITAAVRSPGSLTSRWRGR